MNHKITTRSLDASEASKLKKAAKLTIDDWAWILLPIYGGGGLGFFAGKFCSWLILKFGGTPIQGLPAWVAVSIACVGVVPAIWLFRVFVSRNRKLLRDAASREVEVVEVCDAIILQQSEYNDEGPIFYFGIGSNKVLFVWGQWLFDPSIYPTQMGLKSEDDEEMWPPFPCRSFVLHRLSHSGQVLLIDPKSERAEPDRTLQSKEIPLAGQPDSLLLEGDLDDLKAIMAKTTRKRTGSGPVR